MGVYMLSLGCQEGLWGLEEGGGGCRGMCMGRQGAQGCWRVQGDARGQRVHVWGSRGALGGCARGQCPQPEPCTASCSSPCATPSPACRAAAQLLCRPMLNTTESFQWPLQPGHHGACLHHGPPGYVPFYGFEHPELPAAGEGSADVLEAASCSIESPWGQLWPGLPKRQSPPLM